jgi:hypothetical protein
VSTLDKFDAAVIMWNGANATGKFSDEGELPRLELSGIRSGGGVERKSDIFSPFLPGREGPDIGASGENYGGKGYGRHSEMKSGVEELRGQGGMGWLAYLSIRWDL